MKKNLPTLLSKYLLAVLILLSISTGLVYADNGNSHRVNVHPGAIHFDIETPVSEVPGDKVLYIERKKNDFKGDIFYQLIDNSSCSIDLAKYIKARTPYSTDYQTLDKPVLFLAKEDNITTIRFKLVIDDKLWSNLVNNSNYKLELISDKGQKVNIFLKVKKSSYMTVYPDIINIFADKGPGTYDSQERATVYIDNMDNKWNLYLKASPLIYQDRDWENIPAVQTEDIYVSIDDSENFISLADTYYINGENYGNTAAIDLRFKVKVGYEHLAGKYRGQIILTISGK